MKLSDYIIDFLASESITYVFEVVGGAITHLVDSLYGRKDIMALSMHHEQAAAFAAEGYSRISGKIGVAMATSGPGATNLITGIGSCFFDSVPCIFITGQVNTYEYKFTRAVRQIGFQETDIVNIVKPIVKDSILVTDPEKIRYYLERAVHIAKSGRPGPVLLDIPMNIQRAEVNPKRLKTFSSPSAEAHIGRCTPEVAARVVKSINNSLRPVVLVGGGIRTSKSKKELLEFIAKTKIPVVTSLMGLDAFPHDNSSFTGMLGSYGNRYANLTVANCDFLLVLGARLDTRQTGTRPETFAREAEIVQVDIDENELRKPFVDLSVRTDLKQFLSVVNLRLHNYDKKKIEPWRKIISKYRERYPSGTNTNDNHSFNPNFIMRRLSEFLPEDAIVCVDIGQNQMWAAQSLMVKKSQRFLTQGGMGAMGSALPMAIGASLADLRKMVVVITGDGGFQLNIQELQTVYHHRLPIKIIMLHNSCYGMVRQFQQQYFNRRFQSTVIGYSCPDFQKVVTAYGIPAAKIASGSSIDGYFKKLFRNSLPAFLEIPIPRDTTVVPKLSVNCPIENQDPKLSRKELGSNMLISMLPESGKRWKKPK